MKSKIAAVLICGLLLSGCGSLRVYDGTVNSSKTDTVSAEFSDNEQKDKSVLDTVKKGRVNEYEYIRQKYMYPNYFEEKDFSDMNISDDIKNITLTDFLKQLEVVDDIKIIQKNGEDVKVYKDKKFNDIYMIVEAGDYEKQYNNKEQVSMDYFTPLLDESLKYTSEIEQAEKEGLILNSFSFGGQNDLLIFSNSEIRFLAQENVNIIFSIDYNDVDIEFNNIPIRFMIYYNDGMPSKLEVIYTDVIYNHTGISDLNKRQINLISKITGIDSEIIINALTDTGGKKGKKDNINWENKRGLYNNGRYSFNCLSVNID